MLISSFTALRNNNKFPLVCGMVFLDKTNLRKDWGKGLEVVFVDWGPTNSPSLGQTSTSLAVCLSKRTKQIAKKAKPVKHKASLAMFSSPCPPPRRCWATFNCHWFNNLLLLSYTGIELDRLGGSNQISASFSPPGATKPSRMSPACNSPARRRVLLCSCHTVRMKKTLSSWAGLWSSLLEEVDLYKFNLECVLLIIQRCGQSIQGSRKWPTFRHDCCEA